MCVCQVVWGSVVAVDGVVRAGAGSVVVLRCVCLCMGRVASVVSVARHKVAVGIKVLERPGIKPGTIRYLDWMLYH